MQCGRSELKIWGSDKNTKSGEARSVKVLRLYTFLFRPSIFHVREVIVVEEGIGAGLSASNELLG